MWQGGITKAPSHIILHLYTKKNILSRTCANSSRVTLLIVSKVHSQIEHQKDLNHLK